MQSNGVGERYYVNNSNFIVHLIGWQEDIAGYGANYFENVEVIGNIHDNPELIER